MEDIVAVKVVLKGGGRRYFMTWGRVRDAVDGSKLEGIVLKHASKFALGGTARRAELCRTLQEAAKQPYFYEALFSFARAKRPDTAAWKKKTDRRMRRGQDLYYLGNP